MNYNDELFLVEHLPSNIDTKLYLIKRKRWSTTKVTCCRNCVSSYWFKQWYSEIVKTTNRVWKKVDKCFERRCRSLLKSVDVEKNMYKSLIDNQLKAIINKCK